MRGRGGTETARPLDVGRAAVALRRAGIDPRHWVSYGTVCALREDGTTDFSDASAVYVAPAGVSVDVLLMPANQHVTARYSGVQGGSAGTLFTPIKPGDEVLVVIPDGDLRLPPVVVCILSGEHSPLPLGQDRRPIWKNDRVLLHGRGVAVEIRTSGGGVVTVEADGDVAVNGVGVNINSGSEGAAREGDSVRVTLSPQDITDIAASMVTAGLVSAGGGGPPPTPVVLDGGEITSSSGTVKIG